jgi:TolA-binding protein
LGRKQRRTGKHLFYLFTGLIIAGMGGCATVQQSFVDFETYSLFKETHVLMGMHDFDAATTRNRKVLEEDASKPPADTALYNLGLIHAHRDNPDRDFALARTYFTRLTDQFPTSQFSEEAKAWISVLNTIQECRQRQPLAQQDKTSAGPPDFEAAITADLKLLARDEDRPDPAVLYRLGLLSAHYANPKKDYKKAAAYMQRLVDQCPDSLLVDEARIWLGVFDVIDKIQQVDIEIEEKKKELSQ